MHGEREFAYKNYFSDKAGLARRLKSQTHRRRILQICATSVDTKGSVAELRETFALTPAVDVLKLFLSHEADTIVSIFNRIESLDDFNQ